MVKNKFQILFETAPIAIVEANWRKTIEVLNFNTAAFVLSQAKDKQEFIRGFNRLLGKVPKKTLLELLSARVKGELFEAEFYLPTFRNKRAYVLMRLAYIKPTPMSSHHILLTFQDITRHKRQEVELKKLAQLDGLTKILNHRAILQRLEEELSRARRHNFDLSCVIFDLDSFKKVNDTLGHLYGDKYIKQAVNILKLSLRKTDIIGRYGGDEFLVILPETKMEQSLVPVRRILESYAPIADIKYKDKSVRTSFSVGISGYPFDGLESKKDLIRAADQALYLSKQLGGNQVNLYRAKKL